MRLSKLEPSTRKKGRWLCHLEDGTILRLGEGEVVAFSLYTGMDLDDEARARLTAAAQTAGAKDRALNLLTNRPLSRRELVRKLMEKDTAEREAEEIADWLERLGLLDDEAYAKSVVKHYGGKGYGIYKIKDELYRRGVPRELWDGALGESEGHEAAIDAFLRQKLRGEAPDRKELKRVSDALSRRGYRWEEISAGLRRYGAQTELEEE